MAASDFVTETKGRDSSLFGPIQILLYRLFFFFNNGLFVAL
jgi:hypothetical protein